MWCLVVTTNWLVGLILAVLLGPSSCFRHGRKKENRMVTTGVKVSTMGMNLKIRENESLLEEDESEFEFEERDMEVLDGPTPPPVQLPCDQWLSGVVKCRDPEPVFLKSGSFGQAWLVQDKTLPRKEVLKMFYFKDKDNVTHHVTTQNMLGNKKAETLVDKAVDECTTSKELREGPKGTSYSGNGAQRIMICYGTNVGQTTTQPEEPLYLLLESCGSRDLTQFLKDHRTSGGGLEILSQLFKQVLEAIEFLNAFKPPYLHHDLKPDNIAVKDHGGPDGGIYHTVHLIDLGELIPATRETLCTPSASTRVYAGHEWLENTGEPDCRKSNFDGQAPERFDIYSAAAIWVYMLTGKLMVDAATMVNSMLPDEERITGQATTTTKANRKVVNHRFINAVSQRKEFLEELTQLPPDKIHETCRKVLHELSQNEDAMEFTRELLQGLRFEAKDRPLAADLLQFPYMKGIKTHDDPEFNAAETEEATTVATTGLPTAVEKPAGKVDMCNILMEAFDNGKLFIESGLPDCPEMSKVETLARNEDDTLTATFTCDGKAKTKTLDCARMKYKDQ